MSYGISNNLPRLRNYSQAHAYFEGRAKPPRSKNYAINERPLASVSHAHYKIIKHDNYYDIRLYSTIMARYYAPDADGGLRQLYMGHNSITSRSFMWQVLGVGGVNDTQSDKGQVILPVYSRSSIEDKDGMLFSLDAYFKDDKLITSKSSHTPHYKFLSNTADKSERAQKKANLANFVMLATMRLPDYKDNVTLDHSMGRPFGEYNFVHHADDAVKGIINGTPTEENINTFFKVGQAVYDMLASKRGYEQQEFNLSTWRGTKSTIDDLAKPITESDFEVAMTKRCLVMAGAYKRSERIEIPQFPLVGDYPRSNVNV
jgi:hypothetical protein